ncbi:hypothetical protein JXA88_09345, partial [Candidatus Fermentibacteria bacterium]|nr:hypothetical protein [Candidatus Fermentibacteria bacterium]
AAVPDYLYAQMNWWGDSPPDAGSFGGRVDHIVYDPWLNQSLLRPQIPGRDAETATLLVYKGDESRAPDGEVSLSYRVARPGRLVIQVWDLLGRRVRTLVDRQVQEGGGVLTWDGRDESGVAMANGCYVGRLRCGDNTASCRFVLVR